MELKILAQANTQEAVEYVETRDAVNLYYKSMLYRVPYIIRYGLPYKEKGTLKIKVTIPLQGE